MCKNPVQTLSMICICILSSPARLPQCFVRLICICSHLWLFPIIWSVPELTWRVTIVLGQCSPGAVCVFMSLMCAHPVTQNEVPRLSTMILSKYQDNQKNFHTIPDQQNYHTLPGETIPAGHPTYIGLQWLPYRIRAIAHVDWSPVGVFTLQSEVGLHHI